MQNKEQLPKTVAGIPVKMVWDNEARAYYPEPDEEAIAKDTVILGKYGQARHKYLYETRKSKLFIMQIKGELAPYLQSLEEQAQALEEQTIKAIATKQGVTEDLKNSNPLLWASKMATISKQAEEIVMNELIFVK